jgi:hypothetical protein
LAEKPVKLSTGGIEGVLLLLGAAAMEKRAIFVVDRVAKNLFDILHS